MADDLLVMIQHTRGDMSFREGGTFNAGKDFEDFDEKDAKKVLRAIEFIKKLIIESK